MNNFFMNMNQLQHAVLLLFVSYLATLLMVMVAFVPGAGENLVRFLAGLKQVARFDSGGGQGKLNNGLITAVRQFLRDVKIPLVLKLLVLLIILVYVLGKLMNNF